MGNARFDEKHANYEQDIINSLYLMFEFTNQGSNQLEKFQSIIKQKPTVKIEKAKAFSLKDELNNIIKCLDYLEKSKIFPNVAVERFFIVLEKIITGINPLDFEEEMFNGFNTAVNKLIVSFSKNHALSQEEGAEVVILKYGDLIALIHNMVITKISNLSNKLLKRLENNEKESALINNKIVNLENTSKKQIKVINQIVSTVRSLPEK